jgi:hypothetical protein
MQHGDLCQPGPQLHKQGLRVSKALLHHLNMLQLLYNTTAWTWCKSRCRQPVCLSSIYSRLTLSRVFIMESLLRCSALPNRLW